MIVERLAGITKVGRRERPESFLHLTEIYVPRSRLRESRNNLCQGIKIVYERDDSKSSNIAISQLRIFAFRRLVGTIGPAGMKSELATALERATAVCLPFE